MRGLDKYYTMCCAYCGDLFKISDNRKAWAYKRAADKKHKKKLYFCSWGCLCKYDREGKPNRWRQPIAE